MDTSSENPGSQQECSERRVIRSQYLAVKNIICDDGEDIGNVNSNNFCSIIRKVEDLHQHVQRPREQVADAETMLHVATSLVRSLRSQRNGPTPSDFVDALARKFGMPDRDCTHTNYLGKASWQRIGMSVSHIFMRGHGYCTMNGPMVAEVKPKRCMVRGKRTRPTQSSQPEDVGETEGDPAKKTDTDKNMLTMFTILRKQKQTKLEYLVLNRQSFAQTVENIFALSFLVKDGRVEITVDKNGHHFVSPRNAPAAASIMSGELSYNHFIFRFDIKDWKSMRKMVAPGEELMPHRFNSVKDASLASNISQVNSGTSNSVKYATLASASDQVNSGTSNSVKYATLASVSDQVNSGCFNSVKDATLVSNNGQVNTGSSEPGSTSTPIKTLTRYRGLVMREDSVRNDSLNRSSLEEVLFISHKCRRLNDNTAQ